MVNFDQVGHRLWKDLEHLFGDELIYAARNQHSYHFHVAHKLKSGGYVVGKAHIAFVDPSREIRYGKFAPEGSTYMVHIEVISNVNPEKTCLHYIAKTFDTSHGSVVNSLKREYRKVVKLLH